MCHAGGQGGEAFTHLPALLIDSAAQLVDLVALVDLGFAEGVEGLGVGAELGADFGDVVVGTGGEGSGGALRCFQWVTQREDMYAGSGWVRVGSGSLAAVR